MKGRRGGGDAGQKRESSGDPWEEERGSGVGQRGRIEGVGEGLGD